MYRFQLQAQTQTGESIGLVGSTPELGSWDVTRCILLQTTADRYPLWWTDPAIDLPAAGSAPTRVNYKYVRLAADGTVAQWESWITNRWLAIEPDLQSTSIVVDDGAFGYVQPYPFGYIEPSIEPPVEAPMPPPADLAALKIVVIGSSVAVGYKAWLLKGWVELLSETLQQKFGHVVINVAEVGANVSRTIERWPQVVAPLAPDIVIIALSLGNEGLADWAPGDRRAGQRRFESGLQQLVKMTRALGARPILGGVYAHNDYTAEAYALLQATHQRMLHWGVPVLDWLAAVDDGQGHWLPGISFDPAHPNTVGQRLMYEAIDLSLFQVDKTDLAQAAWQFQQTVPVYEDAAGFRLTANLAEKQLQISNPSPHTYTVAAYWQELQTALQTKAELPPGLYLAQDLSTPALPYLAVRADGTIETLLTIAPGVAVTYQAASTLFAPNATEIIFDDGQLGILRADEQSLWVINDSDHEFNLHPMWPAARSALKAMPPGVYHDPRHPDAPFRTLMIDQDGLASRVKAPPRSALLFRYQCPLHEISRVAIIPLGDRCAVRMMLYKLEYDGPAFPFDLTRTTRISDIADIVTSGFTDMWNPDLLHYNDEAGRIYHSKWSGLSFAHEVDETDDPLTDMSPIHERMRSRYSARAGRFWYVLKQCDQALFVRTGIADRGGVLDLLHKLAAHCQDKPFQLLLLSPQDSTEFADLPQVSHYNVEFNPDHMYADDGHWMYCTDIMRGILTDLGISSQNLFWCPPKPPR
jgi:lysophospholipase L1-like esterase